MDFENEEQASSQSASDSDKLMSRLQVYKNLVVVGMLSLFQYSATNPTNALVTSTAGKTLGNIAYSLNYLFSAVFILLSIPVLNSRIKEKEILWMNNVALIIFTIGNVYISYYTLIPASIFHGMSVAMACVTSLVYVNKLAVHYAEVYKLDSKSIISFFGGIYIAFALAGYLVGNSTAAGIISLLKSKDIDDINNTFYDTNLINSTMNFTGSDKECHTNDDAVELTFLAEIVLRGAIIAYSVLALLTTAFLDDFDKYYRIKYVLTLREKVNEVTQLLWPRLKSTAKVAMKKKMCLTSPLFVTIGVTNGFIIASYTKVHNLA